MIEFILPNNLFPDLFPIFHNSSPLAGPERYDRPTMVLETIILPIETKDPFTVGYFTQRRL